jgi:L-lysine 2,3-aminomutase
MPESTYGEHFTFLRNDQRLSFDEIERLCRIAAELGVSKLRLTGGEPLLRPKLAELVARLRRIDGITFLWRLLARPTVVRGGAVYLSVRYPWHRFSDLFA